MCIVFNSLGRISS